MVNVTLMGPNLVPVPTHFFQIALRMGAESETVEAHLVPNAYVPHEKNDVTQFRASVGSISEKTGLRFDPRFGR